METATKLNSLSFNDSKRLEKSFFSDPTPQSPRQKINYKLVTTAVLLVLMIIGTTFFFANFNLIIIPQYKQPTSSATIDLMKNGFIKQPSLVNPQYASKIAEGTVYIDLPLNKKSGFMLPIKNKLDISNSIIKLIIKKPAETMKLFVVLRDTNFLSNSTNPIAIKIAKQAGSRDYLTIPIVFSDVVDGNISLKRINQIRFLFYQEEKDFFPIFVKNVFFEKGGK